MTMTDATTTFERHRRLLKSLAYRMLGSVAEAEDIVQDCWLRWREVDHAKVETPKAFLAQTATRLCLDRLRSASLQREQYVGVWLPDPWLEDQASASTSPGADDMLAMAQDLEIAFLLVLHRLTPAERAVFLLNEVFDWDFDAIAQVLDRSPAACRQLAHRARRRMAAPPQQASQQASRQAPRQTQAHESGHADTPHETSHQDTPRHTPSPRNAARDTARDMAVAVAFAEALRGGDLQTLAKTLADDVVFMSDGGGKASAVPRPLHGPAKVAQVLLGFSKLWYRDHNMVLPAAINGMPGGIFVDAQGAIVQTMAIGITAQGLIDGVYVMRNPDKLTHIARP